MKVGVIGAGSWGCALAILLQNNGCQVSLWGHRREQIEKMQVSGECDKLPGVMLPKEMSLTWDLSSCLLGKDLLVLAVPSTATRETAEKIKPYVEENQILCSVSKGIEEDSLLTQCGILEGVLGKDAKVGVLSGPSHAEEVVKGLPTVVVAGSRDIAVAEFLQNAFMNENFRVYTSTDVTGIEIGASLKNVIALAAGMSDGLGYGDNTKAALITRGIKEISSLALAMGGLPQTLSGLAGTGDLIVTCSSRHSRNRKAGMLIGQGVRPKDAMDQVHMVVEGVYSAKAALALGKKYQVSLPIIEQVNEVLFHDVDPRLAVRSLMERDKKSEIA
ncbi:MAG: NAD(P)H-dependent glycerol-3-phosphate dehydrogenase [Roseburia lenta]|nr:NAD(P)H-dependent glycerol-3-phosphate dehydrogenase [Roseburia lenta]